MMASTEYEKCKFFSTLHNCGDHKRSRTAGVYSVTRLKEEVKNHLINIGLTITEEGQKLTEKALIENRSGTHLAAEEFICAFHRNSFCIYWRSSTLCQHPLHPQVDFRSVKKARAAACRPATLKLAREIAERYQITFPVGSKICSQHRVINIADMPVAAHNEVEVRPDDDVEVAGGSREDLDEFVDNLIHKESVSPMKFQVKSPVHTLAPSTVCYLGRKYKQYQSEFKKILCERIAPGQGGKLEQMLSESSDTETDEVDEFLKTLLEAYKDCMSEKSRIAILSMVPVDKYSKQKLMEVFHCSRFQVDKARKLKDTYGPAGIVPEPQWKRQKLDCTKAEHFLDYLFESGALQDVAYGTTTLKYDSGDTQTVPHAVITSLKSHVIYDYQAYCQDVDYQPLSRSALWNILGAIKPSQRRALGGLDNTTADGLEGIDGLTRLLQKEEFGFDDIKMMTHKLESGKRYIKMAYKMHCEDTSTCATHCCEFALSNSNDKDFRKICTHPHEMSCPECCDLIGTLDNIQMQCDKKGDPELSYDVKRFITMVLEWFRHSLRGVQQDKAKRDSMKCIDDTSSAFWLKDWAQKVLPLSFREKQSDYFGKKGMSLAVDVFFQRNDSGNLTKLVYFTILFRCDQDMVSTLNVADHVLKQYKTDNPKVTKLFVKSDNAGCYAAGSTFEAEYNICKSYGVQLMRHDFNEPQCGKDQADRESAIARKLMRAYVDAGNDLLSAEDVKSAIQYKSGVPNAQVSIIEIDKTRSSVTHVKIPNCQSLHSVEFQENEMNVWQYYEIGQGKVISYSTSDFVSGVDEISPFTSQRSNVQFQAMDSKQRQDRSYCSLIFCSDSGCSQEFKSEEDLEEHLASGSHTYSKVKSGMDSVRSSFAQRINTNSMLHSHTTAKAVEVDFDPTQSIHAPLVSFEGWALKPKRRQTRLTVKQKSFVLGCFLKGEKTGKKTTAENVVTLMRSTKDLQGIKMFSPEDYLTREQVISQFSQFTTKKKRGETLDIPAAVAIDAREEDDDDNDEQVSDEEDLANVQESDAQAEQRQIVDELITILNEENVDNETECQTGDYAIVQCGEKYYVGMVLAVDGQLYHIKYMKQTGSYFGWLDLEHASWQHNDDIRKKLSAPSIDRRGHYIFSQKDAEKITEYM